MTENNEPGLFQKDRRQGLRSESGDRRQNLRPSRKMLALRVIVSLVLILIGFFAVYLINPKI